MKIIFFSRLYLPHIGGVERHLAGLSKKLKETNEIAIITEKYSSDLKSEETIDGIKVIRISGLSDSRFSKKWAIWKWIFSNRKFINSFDIIHCHDVVYWIYPLLLTTHPKIFATFHGWEGKYPLPFKNVIKKRLDAKLVSGSIGVGDFINKWYGIKTNVVTYGASSLKRIKPVKLPTNSLLFLGRLENDTGLSECIDRFSRLESVYKWNLVVAGDGPLKSTLPKNALYLGPISNPEDYISASKYVYATGYLSILEAFLYKKVVLSSYNNELKKDYLTMHPMSKHLTFDDHIPKVLNYEAIEWAKQQTWEKLTGLYNKLWSL